MDWSSRLLRTTAFRLSLSYLIIFTASAVTLIAVIYLTSNALVERQIMETIAAEIRGLSDQYRERGLVGLAELIHERGGNQPGRQSLYLLTGEDDRPIAGNLSVWPRDVIESEGWLRVPVRGQRGVDAIARWQSLPGGYRLLVGRSLHDVREVQRAVTRAMFLGLAATVVLGIVGSFVMSRQILQRIEGVNASIRRITRGEISQRLPRNGSDDEFDQLVANVNAMLDQIERLIDSIRAVSDNIAHDLRTPLHRLRSRIDVALMGDDAGELRATLEQTLAEADNLLATFNALLTIARAEAGARLGEFGSVDLAVVAHDVCELYEPLAEDRGVHLTCAVAAPLPVSGDRHLLSQALANLLDNAAKYTPPGGRVGVEVDPRRREVVVWDTGPGVPAEAREKVLERFSRLDATRSTPGNGLGLSLVAAVARLHDARLLLEDNQPGLRVRLVFPEA